MNSLTTRSRVTIGLACLLVSVLLVGMILGIVPDQEQAVVEGRRALCESIAVSTSLLVSQHDLPAATSMLEDTLRRNKDILSAGLRRRPSPGDGARGTLDVEVGDHAARWTLAPGDRSTETQMQVPIRQGDRPWGTMEICFRSASPPSVVGRMLGARGQLVVYVAAACALLFLFYLRKVLEYLDPSQVVPPHVRAALDTLAEGLLIIDSRGRVVLANRSFAALLRRSSESLVGQLISRLPWIEDADENGTDGKAKELPWAAALARKEPVTNAAVRMRTADGQVRTFLVSAAPVLGHKNDYRGALVSFEDITPLEAKERELRTARDAADAANRTKSEFLANMSHDIRTPMNTILGFTDLIRRGLVGNEKEMRHYLDTIHSSGKHLLELINDILDLSKIEAGRLEIERRECDPLTLAAELVAMFSVPARTRGLMLELTTQGKVPATVHTDPTRVRQILTNLIGNALKFTEKGGVKLVVRLAETAERPQLAIDVADTGIGIAQSSLSRIFDPFVQADSSVTRRYGGTGLGLAISRRFAEALGGELTVKSTAGQGSTFTVTFDTGSLDGVAMLDAPRIPDRAPVTPATSAGMPKFPPARILVADDGEATCQLLTVILGRAGLTVRCVSDGAAAVEAAGKEAFDLIFMDMQMPVMDGYTATSRLRERGMTLPIIALTANAMKGDEEKCRAAGCSGFLPKPIDIDQLLRTIAAELRVAAASTVSTSPERLDEAQQLLRQQLNALHVAWQNGDKNGLVEQIGNVQTTAGTLGDEEIRALTARLETLAATNDNAGLENVIEELAVEVESRLLDRTRFARRPAAPAAPASRHPHAGGGGLSCSLPLDDPDFRPIVEGFVARLREQLAAMETARDKGDLRELARIAHWLKGAGGTMGFAALTSPAAVLEQAAKSGLQDEVDTTLELIAAMTESIVLSVPAAEVTEHQGVASQ